MKLKTPFLGVAYYPEDWPDAELDRDIAKMKELGIRAARIAEFAWRKMEPMPGEYRFDWLHTVIGKLADAGIGTVLCTPTATPPIWLGKAHPEIFVEDANGIRMSHGGRRHCCSNQPAYRDACRRITHALGREFGDDPRIIGWQIDNELDFQYCRCDVCLSRFHDYLREKYGTVEHLNEEWNLNLFSQAYDSFDEIPFPEHNWHNPQLKLEALLFDSATQVAFSDEQVDILHTYTKAPVGTDAKPYQRIDYEQLEKKCDILEFNHYHRVDDLPEAAMWFDLLRPLSRRPFWNTETATCWNGSTTLYQSVKPYGFCRVNSWMPVMLGGEAAMYWLWRTHWAGHELVHGGVLYPNGRPYPVADEIRRIASEFDLASDFLQQTKVETEVAMHFTSLGWNMMTSQSVLRDYEYRGQVYRRFYHPLTRAGLRPDVIVAGQDLSRYKLLFTPLLLSLEEGDLPTRIARFVREGGVLVAGPLTDVRNRIGARYRDRAYGILEELTGARQAYEVPDYDGATTCAWKDGTPFAFCDWLELYEDDGDALATVTAGYPSLIGKSPLLRKQVGRGVVYLVGAVPDGDTADRILRLAVRDAGVALPDVTGDLVYVPRAGDGVRGLCVAECANAPASIVLSSPMTDLLSGRTLSGKVDLAPYDVLILKEK